MNATTTSISPTITSETTGIIGTSGISEVPIIVPVIEEAPAVPPIVLHIEEPSGESAALQWFKSPIGMGVSIGVGVLLFLILIFVVVKVAGNKNNR